MEAIWRSVSCCKWMCLFVCAFIHRDFSVFFFFCMESLECPCMDASCLLSNRCSTAQGIWVGSSHCVWLWRDCRLFPFRTLLGFFRLKAEIISTHLFLKTLFCQGTHPQTHTRPHRVMVCEIIAQWCFYCHTGSTVCLQTETGLRHCRNFSQPWLWKVISLKSKGKRKIPSLMLVWPHLLSGCVRLM